jgi:hypothetical protein
MAVLTGLAWFAVCSEGRWLLKDPTRQEQPCYLGQARPAEVRTLTHDPHAPESAGLPTTPGNDGLELLLVARASAQ